MNLSLFISTLFFFLAPELTEAKTHSDPTERANQLNEVLGQRKPPKLVSIKKRTNIGKTKISRVKISSPSVLSAADEIEASFTYYQTPGENKEVVFLLSPIFGITPMDHWIAINLARFGVNTVISYYGQDTKSIDEIPAGIVKSMQAQMSIVDWVAQREEVDSSRFGMAGISLGGIRTAFIMGADPRMKAATIVVGGGNFADILTDSGSYAVKLIRRQHMKAESISDKEEYRQRVNEVLNARISDLLWDQDGSKFQLYLDRRDRFVPSSSQEYLEAILPEARVTWTNIGHIAAAGKFASSEVKVMLDFMREHW